MDDPNEMPSSGFVTTAWVKKRYSISNSTLYQWAADKRLCIVKIGPRAVRVRVDDLRAFEAQFEDRTTRDVKPR